MLINNKTFCIITLGCRTNICESNDITNQLLSRGAKLVKNVDDANICIINTCCVTNKAEAKSRYFINRAIKSKKSELLVVVGCLAQLNPRVVDHSKIGIVLGSKNKNEIGK
jgi:threonylcarbamoyladenosine tRNA methylthiotransferase MtaB